MAKAQKKKTGKPEAESGTLLGMQPDLGRRLRDLREASGLALHEVADQTGVSKSFLSLVEVGRSDLSVNRFMRICEFYGVKPSAFLRGASEDTDGASSDSDHFLSPAEGSELVMLRPPDAGSALLPVMTIYKPGAVTETFQHAGDEFVFVVEGRIRLVISGDSGEESILLKERESHYFNGESAHRFENPDKRRKAIKLSVQSEDRW
ncbi:MAG: helix-turn-helix domain-containing protein [Candidatus Nanopelagicales bacterium]